MVKKEIIESLKFSDEELKIIHENQNKIYEENELKKKKEIEDNEQNHAKLLNEHRLNHPFNEDNLNSDLAFNLNNLPNFNAIKIGIPYFGEYCANLTPGTNKVFSQDISIGSSSKVKNKKSKDTIKSTIKKKVKTENCEKASKIISSKKKKTLTSPSKIKKIDDYVKINGQIQNIPSPGFDLSQINFNTSNDNKQ